MNSLTCASAVVRQGAYTGTTVEFWKMHVAKMARRGELAARPIKLHADHEALIHRTKHKFEPDAKLTFCVWSKK
jgi:hypothetical protein